MSCGQIVSTYVCPRVACTWDLLEWTDNIARAQASTANPVTVTGKLHWCRQAMPLIEPAMPELNPSMKQLQQRTDLSNMSVTAR